MITKQQKIKYLKEELDWVVESIKIRKKSIKENKKKLKKKNRYPTLVDNYKDTIKSDGYAIKQFQKQIPIIKAIFEDYARNLRREIRKLKK